eukprot:1331937-Pleurochrysis_carterae.AAC.1
MRSKICRGNHAAQANSDAQARRSGVRDPGSICTQVCARASARRAAARVTELRAHASRARGFRISEYD